MPSANIIDAHTHAYAAEVINDPGAWGKAHGEDHWLKLHVPEDGKALQDWCSVESMIQRMDEAGISKSILLGWYWEKHENCLLQNRWYNDWHKEYPDRFIPFAAVQPQAGDAAIDSLKEAVDNGFRGIGEMLPQVQGFKMQDPQWCRVVEFCIENNLLINMHVTEAVGRDHPGRIPTPFSEFQWLAETYPEAKIILAHWGGLLPFYEMNAAVKKAFKNIYYDTAASPLLYKSNIHSYVVNSIGHEKILYGSDYPLRVYPAKQEHAEFKTFLNEIQESGLDKGAIEGILSGNIERLLKS